MKLWRRYYVQQVLTTMALVALVLGGIECFILLMNEFKDVGRGDYTLFPAFCYVILRLPGELYALLPIVAMMGGLLAAGQLAKHNEITVLRAAGVAIWQWVITTAVMALLLGLTLGLLAEMTIPNLTYLSENYKLLHTTFGQALRTEGGFWLKQGNDYLHFTNHNPQQPLQNMTQYHVVNGDLQFVRFAKSAVKHAKHWWLYDVQQTTFLQDRTVTKAWSRLLWDVHLHKALLAMQNREPDEMSLWELAAYLRLPSQGHLKWYQLAFWQRLANPLTMAIMLVLALSFVFGSVRSLTLGARLSIGIALSFSFFILHQFSGPISLLYAVPVVVAAFAPSVIFLLLTLVIYQWRIH